MLIGTSLADWGLPNQGKKSIRRDGLRSLSKLQKMNLVHANGSKGRILIFLGLSAIGG
jgi:hypothetical protein